MGCNCGGGRGREVTVSSAGRTFATGEEAVKFRHTGPGAGYTDYNTAEEAEAAMGLLGGTVDKVDQVTGRKLD